MQTNPLIIVNLIILAFYINYVITIHCYVCNSYDNKQCQTIASGGQQSDHKVINRFYKDCDLELETKLEYYRNATLSASTEDDARITQCHVCESYAMAKRFKQCRHTILTLRDENGVESERTIRECAGLMDASNGCNTIIRKDTKIEQCICNSDACNSSHQTIDYNTYANLLLSIVSLLFLNY